MTSVSDCLPPLMSSRLDSMLTHAPPTSHSLPVAAPTACAVMYSDDSAQILFDTSSSTQARSFFLPDYSPPAAAPEFAALASGSVNGQSLEHLAWSSPANGMPHPQCTFLAHVPTSRGIADITGLPPDRRDDSRRHSTVKEDSKCISARDLSLRKQRVAKESLRRKKMSKWFSKLEVLLPQEDICKFDRCSVIDAAINYIRALERTIAETSQSNNCQKPETTDELSKQSRPSCWSTRSPSPVVEEQGDSQSVVAVTCNLENAFVNAVSCQKDPTNFSSVLSMLQEHQLEVVTASLSRSGPAVVYSAHAKIPSAVNLSSKHLKDEIHNCITSSPSPKSEGTDAAMSFV